MPRLLQICPRDSLPFGDLCARYVAAAHSLDVEAHTLFLAPPTGGPLAFASYLNVQDLARNKPLAAALKAHVGPQWDLVLCHRYRAYKAAIKAGLGRNRCLVLAHEYGLLNGWRRRAERRLLARDWRFAGVAPAVAAELGDGALVLTNVLDVEAARQTLRSKEEALRALGLVPGPLTVAVVGRLHYKKRPGLALDAFRLFARERAGARLVFLGEGDERAALAAAAGDGVHLLGSVPGAARLFNAFDMLLHTASAEPFGMVALEAMLAGVPVVCGRGHGPEYILGELCCYSADDSSRGFAAAMARAVCVDRAALRAAGVSRVRQYFSIDVLARKLDVLLTDGTAQRAS